MEELDAAVARALQAEEAQASLAVGLSKNFRPVTDPLLDSVFPDLHDLFLLYNETYFWGKLHMVEVKWSARMRLCAGVCSYHGREGFCSIRLSEPLLKFRPVEDFHATLLHEMIHAYLFVTHNNRDRDGHGPEFHRHMERINRATGFRITVFHTFHDEVNYYRTHVWRCNGPCQERGPYFGYVRRSMNRSPQPADPWFSQHRATCGGTFTKISAPAPAPPGPSRKRKAVAAPVAKEMSTDETTRRGPLDTYWALLGSSGHRLGSEDRSAHHSPRTPKPAPASDREIEPASCANRLRPVEPPLLSKAPPVVIDLTEAVHEPDGRGSCCVCGNTGIPMSLMNQHLDKCLTQS
ncbi:hypothetical protein IWQ60_002742 [Tieghemiomyces parasiticus]|uniref:SprT-like domain-containing protein n=1 Tax=Tieghemiomyces parasiticus TaxID=78921 RepID=A0A9W8AAS0_9FUNG|nr:hypothetical protein IWQ60_002742 [Tieghemiomyces parasiticus]